MNDIEEALAMGLTIIESLPEPTVAVGRLRQRGKVLRGSRFGQVMSSRTGRPLWQEVPVYSPETWAELLNRIASVEIVPHTEVTRAELEALTCRDLSSEGTDLLIQEASDRWSRCGNALAAL